jgi:hypothetical protein
MSIISVQNAILYLNRHSAVNIDTFIDLCLTEPSKCRLLIKLCTLIVDLSPGICIYLSERSKGLICLECGFFIAL